MTISRAEDLSEMGEGILTRKEHEKLTGILSKGNEGLAEARSYLKQALGERYFAKQITAEEAETKLCALGTTLTAEMSVWCAGR